MNDWLYTYFGLLRLSGLIVFIWACWRLWKLVVGTIMFGRRIRRERRESREIAELEAIQREVSTPPPLPKR